MMGVSMVFDMGFICLTYCLCFKAFFLENTLCSFAYGCCPEVPVRSFTTKIRRYRYYALVLPSRHTSTSPLLFPHPLRTDNYPSPHRRAILISPLSTQLYVCVLILPPTSRDQLHTYIPPTHRSNLHLYIRAPSRQSTHACLS